MPPCPCCGAPQTVIQLPEKVAGFDTYRISCRICQAVRLTSSPAAPFYDIDMPKEPQMRVRP